MQALVRTRKGYAEQLRNLFAYERAIAGVITSFRSVRILKNISKFPRNFPPILHHISYSDRWRFFETRLRNKAKNRLGAKRGIRAPKYARSIVNLVSVRALPSRKDYLYEKGAGSKIHGEPLSPVMIREKRDSIDAQTTPAIHR